MKKENWITGPEPEGFGIIYKIKKHLLSKRSKYQQIDIIENKAFGKMLFLDNDLQIAEKDAHIYNKSLVFPIIKAKDKLNKVAILGGGDGGILYEILKYNPKQVFLVDIDEEVIEVSKKFLKNINKNAFDNKKVKIVIDDANKFLGSHNGFDVIIYDLTMNPGSILGVDQESFLEGLFLKIKKSLSKNGLVSLQCCSEYDLKTKRLLKKMLPKYFKNITFKKLLFPHFATNGSLH